jgi:hypothetical protein
MNSFLNAIELAFEITLKVIISLFFILVTTVSVFWLCIEMFFTEVTQYIIEEYNTFVNSFKEH